MTTRILVIIFSLLAPIFSLAQVNYNPDANGILDIDSLVNQTEKMISDKNVTVYKVERQDTSGKAKVRLYFLDPKSRFIVKAIIDTSFVDHTSGVYIKINKLVFYFYNDIQVMVCHQSPEYADYVRCSGSGTGNDKRINPKPDYLINDNTIDLELLNSFISNEVNSCFRVFSIVTIVIYKYRSYNLFPPFFLIKKVEPKNQGCRKPAKNARVPAKEKPVTAIE
jgi:hypothetical protein